MSPLILGVAAVVVLWLIGRGYISVPAAALAQGLRIVGGSLALSAAAWAGARGRFDVAIVLGLAAVWLFGGGGLSLPGPLGRLKIPGFAPRTVARVRSATLELDIDGSTGALDGRVLVGDLAGRGLDSLSRDEWAALLQICATQDRDGLRLAEAYLDRRRAGWREDAELNAHARRAAGDEAARDRRRFGVLSEQEALEVLGLQAGASADAIREAHRALIKKIHPDQGGSTYLAARVNEAKDVLLDRHR